MGSDNLSGFALSHRIRINLVQAPITGLIGSGVRIQGFTGQHAQSNLTEISHTTWQDRQNLTGMPR